MQEARTQKGLVVIHRYIPLPFKPDLSGAQQLVQYRSIMTCTACAPLSADAALRSLAVRWMCLIPSSALGLDAFLQVAVAGDMRDVLD